MFCSDEWNGVDPGSVLNVAFTRSAGAGISGMYRVIQVDGSTDEANIDSDSFPFSRQVNAGERHEVTFQALFTGAESDVALVATVVRPDQTVHGQPYQCSGTLNQQDQLCTVELFVNGAS
jgi:hypothetical protein